LRVKFDSNLTNKNTVQSSYQLTIVNSHQYNNFWEPSWCHFLSHKKTSWWRQKVTYQMLCHWKEGKYLNRNKPVS